MRKLLTTLNTMFKTGTSWRGSGEQTVWLSQQLL